MRYLRYTFLGLTLWGCDASLDSQSDTEFQSISDSANVGFESEESDKRRGCGEEEDEDDYNENVDFDIDEEEIWDEEEDTREVYSDE